MTICWLNFGRPMPPGRGSAVGWKFLLQPACNVCISLSTFFIEVQHCLYCCQIPICHLEALPPQKWTEANGWVKLLLLITGLDPNLNCYSAHCSGGPLWWHTLEITDGYLTAIYGAIRATDYSHTSKNFLQMCKFEFVLWIWIWNMGLCNSLYWDYHLK